MLYFGKDILGIVRNERATALQYLISWILFCRFNYEFINYPGFKSSDKINFVKNLKIKLFSIILSCQGELIEQNQED